MNFLYLRYVSVLTLVRVRTDQKGLYTVLVTNGDDLKEMTFDLEVQGEPFFKLKCSHVFCVLWGFVWCFIFFDRLSESGVCEWEKLRTDCVFLRVSND